jgi:hypothetical protein
MRPESHTISSEKQETDFHTSFISYYVRDPYDASLWLMTLLWPNVSSQLAYENAPRLIGVPYRPSRLLRVALSLAFIPSPSASLYFDIFRTFCVPFLKLYVKHQLLRAFERQASSFFQVTLPESYNRHLN